jgi:hypothetical protein
MRRAYGNYRKGAVAMNKKSKLTLNQETLKNLTDTQTRSFLATKNTCVQSVCGLACTPAAGAN